MESVIVPRNDRYNQKAKTVNAYLINVGDSIDIRQEKIRLDLHLNTSKLHLNEKAMHRFQILNVP